MADQLADIYRGDTKKWNLTFTDKAGAEIDITGSKIWVTFKTNKDDPDDAALIQNTTIPSGAEAIAGKCQVHLTPAETGALLPTIKYFYDFQFVDASGDVTTLMAGDLRCLQDITIKTA